MTDCKYHIGFFCLGLFHLAFTFWMMDYAYITSDQAADLLQRAQEDSAWASTTDDTILPAKHSEIYAFLTLGGIHLTLSLLSFGELVSLVIKKYRKSYTDKSHGLVPILTLIVIFAILVFVYSWFYDMVPSAVIDKQLFVISILSLPFALASLFLAAISIRQRNDESNHMREQLDNIKDTLSEITTHGQIIGGCALIPKPVLDKLGNPNNVTFRIQGDVVVIEGKN